MLSSGAKSRTIVEGKTLGAWLPNDLIRCHICLTHGDLEQCKIQRLAWFLLLREDHNLGLKPGTLALRPHLRIVSWDSRLVMIARISWALKSS